MYTGFHIKKHRYNFKSCNAISVGYPRKDFIDKQTPSTELIATVATNFSALGYSSKELRKRCSDRQLKLTNDWNLCEYRIFQEESLSLLLRILNHNKNIQFFIKPHPNDPINLWKSIHLPDNAVIVDGKAPINSLFTTSPKFHLCMDGCTTILDAYLADIPVYTFGHFPPLDYSFLNTLINKRLSLSDCDSLAETISSPETIEKSSYSEEQLLFIKEVGTFESSKLLDLCEEVISGSPSFVFYDLPTMYHLRYWLLLLVKRLIRRRPPISTRQKVANS